MNLVIIRSTMRWTHINVQLNSTLPTFTLKLVSNYCAVGRAMACQSRQVRLSHKTFILRHTRLLELSGHLVLNGVILLLLNHLLDHP